MQSDFDTTSPGVPTGEKSPAAESTSSPIISESVEVRPCDSRCRYWAKIVRANKTLPLPVDVDGANDIPGAYLARGDEELMIGDVLFEGEANHHRRTDRGWTYIVQILDANGDLQFVRSGQFGKQKAALKAQGLHPELLAGSGDVAAMVRIAHAVRKGFSLED
jgi:hypothetical protein